MTMFSHIQSGIYAMEKIGLESLESVSLQNRVDSKYIVSQNQLGAIFQYLEKEYYVLEIEGNRVFSYENNYFDTPDFQFYKDHHNGYSHRMKVRSRKYLESNQCFFEIKKKIHLERTQKYREGIHEILTEINEDRLQQIKEFSKKKITSVQLILQNNFNRITLVDKQFSERVTIDTNLTFIDKDQKIHFGDIAIIEIKQSKKIGLQTKLTACLKEKNIREQSISKYIFGVISLLPNMKKNNFLPMIKKIKNLRNS
jgi:hypothetical protein